MEEVKAASSRPQVRHVPRLHVTRKKPLGYLEVTHSTNAPTPSAPPARPQRAPIATQVFTGLNDGQIFIPPDTNGAVGPSHVVTMLNDNVRIHNKTTGATISTVTLDTFMGTSNCFDPRLRYDPSVSRWIAACGAESPSRSVLRISLSSDPTAGFGQLYTVTAAGGEFYDYPQLGFNASAVVISFNIFNFPQLNAFLGCRLLVYNKATVVANSAASATDLGLTNPNTQGFSFMPAITYNASNPGTIYVVQDWVTGTQLRVSTISGLPSTPVLNATPAALTPAQPAWAENAPTPNFGPQYGSTTKIDTGDSRMQHVVHTGSGSGTLYCAHTIFLPASGPTYSAVQWWQLGLDASVVQKGTIDDGGTTRFYAYPSIAVNSLGDILIECAAFSPLFYASSVYTFHASADAAGTTRDVVTFAAGTGTYVELDNNGINRWGDYSACQLDPSDDTFWCLGERAAGSNLWSTTWCHVPNTLPPTQPYKAPCDINGDGKSDIVVWRQSSGVWFTKFSNTFTTSQANQWGAPGDVTLPGHYQGLASCDLAVWRPSQSTQFVLNSPSFNTSQNQTFSPAGDLLHVADLDGDGKADLVTCSSTSYLWRVQRSSVLGLQIQQWGAPGDILVPADYSGSGQGEIAIFRPSSGIWFVLYGNGRVETQQWGQNGDIPVPGDYDGDGKADFAVWRPGNGTWYILNSSGGVVVKQWGSAGDIPTVLDIDGDGRIDFVVYRPSDTKWYITQSSNNAVIVTQWGTSGDIIPAPTSA